MLNVGMFSATRSKLELTGSTQLDYAEVKIFDNNI